MKTLQETGKSLVSTIPLFHLLEVIQTIMEGSILLGAFCGKQKNKLSGSDEPI